MNEYQANGCRLGWLIDPEEMAVTVYRPGAEPARLDQLEHISGDPVLLGFSLALAPIWQPDY